MKTISYFSVVFWWKAVFCPFIHSLPLLFYIRLLHFIFDIMILHRRASECEMKVLHPYTISPYKNCLPFTFHPNLVKRKWNRGKQVVIIGWKHVPVLLLQCRAISFHRPHWNVWTFVSLDLSTLLCTFLVVLPNCREERETKLHLGATTTTSTITITPKKSFLTQPMPLSPIVPRRDR